ncbi:glycerol ABC transporter substrate-binding protein [Halorussus marinus]|uniref:glycerol ABC transporter substrate-binding protein n=1 Tax=Halorussus marinus TaxID=2505976 RepID=UPI0010932DAB|nr:glycerol ABC transporter substrate-binding protein [Halorussus marinus]
MSDTDRDGRALELALAVVGLVAVLYSLLIAARPLAGVTVVAWLFGAYLAWRSFGLAVRFVVAVERIADAMEARADE